jgi:hypothetical protein
VSDPAPDQSVRAQARRAAPRLLLRFGPIVGLVFARDGGIWFWVLLIVLFGYSPSLSWRQWWRYVRTGVRPVASFTTAPASWVMPGIHDVVLELPGTKRIQLIHQLRQIGGMDLVTAKAMVDDAPSVVLRWVSAGAADRAKGLLESVGATVAVRRSVAD